MRSNCAVALLTSLKSGEDEYGNDVYGQTVTVMPGLFAPGGSTERTDGQDTVVTQPTLYLAPGTRVEAIDAVVINPTVAGEALEPLPVRTITLDDGQTLTGDRYQVNGRPNVWTSPRRGEVGVVVPLKQVS